MRIRHFSLAARQCLAFLVVWMAGASPALAGPDGSIDLFHVPINPDGTTGAVDFGTCQGSPTVIFDVASRFAIAVYARLSGPTTAGMSGAEFYVDGLETTQLPPGWTKNTTFAPGVITVGQLSDPHMVGTSLVRRGNVVWSVEGPQDPDCQKGALVFLARIELTSLSGGDFPANHYVSVVAGNPPGSGFHPCPLFTLCNAPLYDIVCVTGGQFLLNPDAGRDCTVAVAQKTWSGVKQLFRE